MSGTDVVAGRIDGIVARLHGLHPRLIDLSLDRLLALLEKLGHPERRLPPIELEVFKGFIFVRLEGGGPRLAEMMDCHCSNVCLRA